MRHHIILEKLSEEFWITDIPETPRIGEHIDFSLMYSSGKKKLIQIFEDNTFLVESITWTKDKDGFVAMLFCDIVS